MMAPDGADWLIICSCGVLPDGSILASVCRQKENNFLIRSKSKVINLSYTAQAVGTCTSLACCSSLLFVSSSQSEESWLNRRNMKFILYI